MYQLILHNVVYNIYHFSYNYYYLDIDECDMETDLCDDETKAVCTNTLGSYECYCKSGFTGDGFNCTGKHFNTYYNTYT